MFSFSNQRGWHAGRQKQKHWTCPGEHGCFSAVPFSCRGLGRGLGAHTHTRTHAHTLGWWARATARCGVGVRSVWRGLSCPAEPFSPPVGAAGLWLPAALGIHLVNGRRVSKAQHLLVPEGTRVVPRYLCDTGLRPSRCSVLPEPHKDVCPSAAPSKSPGLPAAIPSVVASGAPSKCLAD